MKKSDSSQSEIQPEDPEAEFSQDFQEEEKEEVEEVIPAAQEFSTGKEKIFSMHNLLQSIDKHEPFSVLSSALFSIRIKKIKDSAEYAVEEGCFVALTQDLLGAVGHKCTDKKTEDLKLDKSGSDGFFVMGEPESVHSFGYRRNTGTSVESYKVGWTNNMIRSTEVSKARYPKIEVQAFVETGILAISVPKQSFYTELKKDVVDAQEKIMSAASLHKKVMQQFEGDEKNLSEESKSLINQSKSWSVAEISEAIKEFNSKHWRDGVLLSINKEFYENIENMTKSEIVLRQKFFGKYVHDYLLVGINKDNAGDIYRIDNKNNQFVKIGHIDNRTTAVDKIVDSMRQKIFETKENMDIQSILNKNQIEVSPPPSKSSQKEIEKGKGKTISKASKNKDSEETVAYLKGLI